MIIQTNSAANTANANSKATNLLLQKSLEKLSSGFRINSAADDASGLAIADKLRTQNTSLIQSIQNANNGISLVKVADKAIAEQSNIVDSVKAKLLQAKTATTSDEGRESIRKDIVKLLGQLDNIAAQTNYNGTTLLQNGKADTTAGAALSFQVGETSTDTISTTAGVQANTVGLGLDGLKALAADGLTITEAGTQLDLIDDALTTLNGFRSDFGSTQNQLESSVRNLEVMSAQIKNAESTIRDVDYATETANFNKQNILAQAGSYALSQANAMQQNVLRLLQ